MSAMAYALGAALLAAAAWLNFHPPAAADALIQCVRSITPWIGGALPRAGASETQRIAFVLAISYWPFLALGAIFIFSDRAYRNRVRTNGVAGELVVALTILVAVAILHYLVYWSMPAWSWRRSSPFMHVFIAAFTPWASGLVLSAAMVRLHKETVMKKDRS